MAAGLAARARYDDRWIGMIREWRAERRRGVAGVAIHGNARMPGRTGIRAGTDRDCAIVASRAAAGNAGVIESAVSI